MHSAFIILAVLTPKRERINDAHLFDIVPRQHKTCPDAVARL